MGGKNKGQKGQTQTQTNTPWGPQAEQFKAGFSRNTQLFDQEAPFAEFSGVSNNAIGQAEQLYPQVGNQMGATIGGDYLNSNPYLADIVSRSSDNAMSGINATFGGAGRTGGGLHQQAIAEGLGNVASGIYAPAYESERSRQVGATMNAPNVVQGQFGTGSIIEGKDLEQQLAPYTQLQRYMGIAGAPQGFGTTAATGPGTKGRGALAGAAGGAMAGSAILPGWGTAIGAGLGAFGVI